MSQFRREPKAGGAQHGEMRSPRPRLFFSITARVAFRSQVRAEAYSQSFKRNYPEGVGEIVRWAE